MELLRTLSTSFAQIFVPIFVAMGPLTILPIFLAMTEGAPQDATRSLARKAVFTALVVATSLVFLGNLIFRLLGITVDDLRVAGGIILLLIAIYDLIFTRERRKTTEIGTDAGVVPLGVPLIVGPATMTTCVVLADIHGRLPVLGALAVNLLMIGLVLDNSHHIQRFVRPSVSHAFGKVMSLFLAAIAVSMLRAGITAFVLAGV